VMEQQLLSGHMSLFSSHTMICKERNVWTQIQATTCTLSSLSKLCTHMFITIIKRDTIGPNLSQFKVSSHLHCPLQWDLG
jgi:hypothetical protein